MSQQHAHFEEESGTGSFYPFCDVRVPKLVRRFLPSRLPLQSIRVDAPGLFEHCENVRYRLFSIDP